MKLSVVEIMKYSLEKEAIKINVENPFVWASGYRMPIYNDNRILLSSPLIRGIITNEFLSMMDNLPQYVNLIAGTATSGIPFASFLVDKKEVPLVYVRASKKGYGGGNAVEGFLPEYKGKNCILIEDVISTGRSALRASERLAEVGIHVVDIFSIFNYNFISVLKAQSIYTLHDLIHFMIGRYITEEDGEELERWAEDPFSWGGKIET